MITRLLLFGVMCLSVVPATADDSALANHLLVEAVKLVEEAATKSEKEKVAPLQAALGKLNGIVEDLPSSELAVKLITGQPVGFLMLSNLQEQMVRAQLAAGDFEGALATAKEMSPVRNQMGQVPRDRSLNQILEAQLEAGDAEGALAAAGLIVQERIRTEWLQKISRREQ